MLSVSLQHRTDKPKDKAVRGTNLLMLQFLKRPGWGTREEAPAMSQPQMPGDERLRDADLEVWVFSYLEKMKEYLSKELSRISL